MVQSSTITAAFSWTFAILVVAAQLLAPADDIILLSSSSAEHPLTLAGANSPYFSGQCTRCFSSNPKAWVDILISFIFDCHLGPNVFGISNQVPEHCAVQQAAYIVRHGSR